MTEIIEKVLLPLKEFPVKILTLDDVRYCMLGHNPQELVLCRYEGSEPLREYGCPHFEIEGRMPDDMIDENLLIARHKPDSPLELFAKDGSTRNYYGFPHNTVEHGSKNKESGTYVLLDDVAHLIVRTGEFNEDVYVKDGMTVYGTGYNRIFGFRQEEGIVFLSAEKAGAFTAGGEYFTDTGYALDFTEIKHLSWAISASRVNGLEEMFFKVYSMIKTSFDIYQGSGNFHPVCNALNKSMKCIIDRYEKDPPRQRKELGIFFTGLKNQIDHNPSEYMQILRDAA